MSLARILAGSALSLAAFLIVTGAGAATALNATGEGRRAFLKLNCYSCHGMNAAGGMGPNIQHAESGDLSEAVMSGAEGGMPSFRKYATSTDVKNLAAYLNSIGSKNEPTWVDWWDPIPGKK
jgi:mono/diheme cytochrome c family protein